MRDSTQQQLFQLIEPIIEDEGFELVDLEYSRAQKWLLRLFVDRPDVPLIEGFGVAPGEGITLDECAKLSKHVSAVMDVEDVISHAYTLEVSSPGVQRPLRKPKDFKRFQDCSVRVKCFGPIPAHEPENAKPSRNLYGTLKMVEEDHILVQTESALFKIAFEQIAKAHLDPDLDKWMKRAKMIQRTKGE